MENTKLTIYTDGSCLGNPGPGGWAFVIQGENGNYEKSGASAQTTNNQMEMTAVIECLKYILKDSALSAKILLLHTDSQYVKNGITTWIHNWIKNGWRTADKKPVKNKELWQELHSLTDKVKIEWKWVKGHAGNPLNERCDVLARGACDNL